MKTIARFLPGDAIIRLQCVIIVVVALVFSALLGSRFFSVANFQSIGSQLPILGMLALGMGMTMLTGGINLSIIAGANACSLVMAAIIVTHPDNPLFLALALIAGAAVAVDHGPLLWPRSPAPAARHRARSACPGNAPASLGDLAKS